MESTPITKIAEIAFEAGQLIRKRHDNLTVRDVMHKGSDTDIVTVADRESESLIRSRLEDAFPDIAFYGEEGTYAPLEQYDRVFIVDPIDGTTNYLHRYPFYCVSIGLREQGITTAGAVYLPALNVMYTATRGHGAYRDGTAIHVSRVSSLIEANVGTGFACVRAHLKPDNCNFSASIIPQVQGFRRSGSAAIDLCHVADGCLDIYWELLLKPWDYEAARLIAQEAGATVTGFDGGPVNDATGQIVASNGLLHAEIQARINSYLHSFDSKGN